MAVGVHVVLTNTTPGRPGNGWGDVYVIPAGDVTSTLEILYKQETCYFDSFAC